MSRISQRYAKALFSLYESEKEFHEPLEKVLLDITELFSHASIGKFLKNPAVNPDIKKEVLTKILIQEKKLKYLSSFICVLIDKNRLDKFPSITQDFQKILSEKSGMLKGKIVSPEVLEDMDIKKIEDILGKKSHKKVVLKHEKNASLLGGFIVQIGNNVVDLSLRTKINNFLKY